MVYERLRHKFGQPIVGGEPVIRDEQLEERMREKNIKKKVLGKILRANKHYQL